MAHGKQSWLSRIKHPRYLLFVALALASAAPLVQLLPTGEAIVAAFDVGVLGFLLSCIPLWRAGGPESIRLQAQRDDFGEVPLLLLTALICGIVFVTLLQLKVEAGRHAAAGVALVVATLAASWLFANLIMALHYARLFYSATGEGDHEGLAFPGRGQPDFSDFVNFAFVVGMTCQTADIGITSGRIRRVATFHGFFAFVFNLGILALTVNMLAGRS